MEIQIQDLVSSIKKDGIEAANMEAEAIVSEAKKQAEAIVADAKAEAAKIKESSEKEIQLFKDSALLNAEQAKRDAMLAFKTEVQKEFEKILASNVKKSLDAKTLATLIGAALKGEDVSLYNAELNEVNEILQSELAEEIKKGLELKPTKNVKAGFRLAAKDGSGFFDCSDEEITNMLMPFFRDIRL